MSAKLHHEVPLPELKEKSKELLSETKETFKKVTTLKNEHGPRIEELKRGRELANDLGMNGDLIQLTVQHLVQSLCTVWDQIRTDSLVRSEAKALAKSANAEFATALGLAQTQGGGAAGREMRHKLVEEAMLEREGDATEALFHAGVLIKRALGITEKSREDVNNDIRTLLEAFSAREGAIARLLGAFNEALKKANTIDVATLLLAIVMDAIETMKEGRDLESVTRRAKLLATEEFGEELTNEMIGGVSDVVVAASKHEQFLPDVVSLLREIKHEVERDGDIADVLRRSSLFLDQLKQELIPFITEGLLAVSLPDVSVDIEKMKQKFAVTLQNIHLTTCSVSPSNLIVKSETEIERNKTENETTNTNSNGSSSTKLVIGVDGVVISLKDIQWDVRQHNWPHLHDHGLLDVEMTEGSVAVVVRFILPQEKWKVFQEGLKVIVASSHVTLGQLKVTVHNCHHELLMNAVLKMFRKTMRHQIAKEIDSTLSKQLCVLTHKINDVLFYKVGLGRPHVDPLVVAPRGVPLQPTPDEEKEERKGADAELKIIQRELAVRKAKKVEEKSKSQHQERPVGKAFHKVHSAAHLFADRITKECNNPTMHTPVIPPMDIDKENRVCGGAARHRERRRNRYEGTDSTSKAAMRSRSNDDDGEKRTRRVSFDISHDGEDETSRTLGHPPRGEAARLQQKEVGLPSGHSAAQIRTASAPLAQRTEMGEQQQPIKIKSALPSQGIPVSVSQNVSVPGVSQQRSNETPLPRHPLPAATTPGSQSRVNNIPIVSQVQVANTPSSTQTDTMSQTTNAAVASQANADSSRRKTTSQKTHAVPHPMNTTSKANNVDVSHTNARPSQAILSSQTNGVPSSASPFPPQDKPPLNVHVPSSTRKQKLPSVSQKKGAALLHPKHKAIVPSLQSQSDDRLKGLSSSSTTPLDDETHRNANPRQHIEKAREAVNHAARVAEVKGSHAVRDVEDHINGMKYAAQDAGDGVMEILTDMAGTVEENKGPIICISEQTRRIKESIEPQTDACKEELIKLQLEAKAMREDTKPFVRDAVQHIKAASNEFVRISESASNMHILNNNIAEHVLSQGVTCTGKTVNYQFAASLKSEKNKAVAVIRNVLRTLQDDGRDAVTAAKPHLAHSKESVHRIKEELVAANDIAEPYLGDIRDDLGAVTRCGMDLMDTTIGPQTESIISKLHQAHEEAKQTKNDVLEKMAQTQPIVQLDVVPALENVERAAQETVEISQSRNHRRDNRKEDERRIRQTNVKNALLNGLRSQPNAADDSEATAHMKEAKSIMRKMTMQTTDAVADHVAEANEASTSLVPHWKQMQQKFSDFTTLFSKLFHTTPSSH